MKRFPIATAKDRKAFVEHITGSSTFQFQRIDGTQWGIGIMAFEADYTRATRIEFFNADQ